MIVTHWGSANNADEHAVFVDWCNRHIWDDGSQLGGHVDATMGVIDGDQIIAVMAYHNYNPTSQVIEYSGAATSKRWLQRHVLQKMFAYPFDELGCQMLVTRNSAKNTALHRQLTSYGHTPYVIPRLRGRNEDEIIWTLTSEQWADNKFNRRMNGAI